MPSLQTLQQLGQSVWLDHINRGLLRNGELQRLVEEGVTGVTSNPTIFAKAIDSGAWYDDALAQLPADLTPEQAATRLMVEDVCAAADLLAPVYERSGGDDGFVSLEVPPALAGDAQATVRVARELRQQVARDNVMIKVPGTEAGLSAMETLLAEGIHVNVTLLFSLVRYRQVAQTYVRAMAANAAPHRVRSVASFFVSRVDSKFDPLLAQLGSEQAENLRGRVAVANAGLAYGFYQELMRRPEFQEQAERGARPQKLLWASTGTKNPEYSDVLYVDELIGAGTINTMTPATLAAWRDHGRPEPRLERNGAEHQRIWAQVQALQLPVDALMDELEREGVAAFYESYENLVRTVAAKRRARPSV